MILRHATDDDAAGLTSVLEAAYAPFQALGLPPVTEGIADDIRDNNVWVAEVGGKVQGGIVLVLGSRAHIANLGVHPDAGGHGIGKALIETASAASVAAGHKQVHLATHAKMTATQAFYRKLGWQETGREGDKVYFQKQLN
jgi:ribosomal protein S18 acetylase RimI-like enzyme